MLIGSHVTLMTTPAVGWRFGHWEGDVAGISEDLIQTAVTMSANKVI